MANETVSTGNKKITVSFSVDSETRDVAGTLAEERGISFTDFTREAIDALIAKSFQDPAIVESMRTVLQEQQVRIDHGWALLGEDPLQSPIEQTP
jgi:molybdate-binding protein